jgi:hypothetical protein
MALAWLAARQDASFGAATFIVSLQDFSKVGDTAVFLGEPHVDFIEQQMLERGYLDSREMSNMFNLLRSNDLIWSNVVNNYLLGLKPPAFDLLYWNSDGTRMARAAHSWYLRNTYVENNLIKPGKVQLKSVPLDLGQVRLDVYAVGAEKDHIVPWDAAWTSSRSSLERPVTCLRRVATLRASLTRRVGRAATGQTTITRTRLPNGVSLRIATKVAGGRTGLPGSLPDPVPSANPRRWGVDFIRHCGTHPAAMS